VPSGRSTPTSACFAANGKFLVTGTREHSVFVWAVPQKEKEMKGQVVLSEDNLESGGRQLRFWAEIDLKNPDLYDKADSQNYKDLGKDWGLIPGNTSNLAIYPVISK